MSKIIITIDVEPDLHSGKYLGITEGLKRAEKIFKKNNIKPILFVTCDCIEKYPQIFKKYLKKGWEISLHGYRHRRFDELTKNEKMKELERSINCFKKYLGIFPKGFRAPQHSIDEETLDLLEKFGFKYDSSLTPLNFLQFIFFPKKFINYTKYFFSPLNPYKIRKSLLERPVASLIFPFVSLSLRISLFFSKVLYSFLNFFYTKEIIFYAHSWDFINLSQSKLDKLFSYQRFIKNLNCFLLNFEK